mgnify:FL=1
MPNISQKWLNSLDVLTPFTRDYSSGIYASEISRKIKVPQKTVHRKIELLVKNHFLNYTREGKNKNYYLDLDKKFSFTILSMVENYKELDFISKHPDLSIMFNEIPGTFILFGSHAKGIAKKTSDIDLIIIGKENEKVNKLINKYPFEVNILYFTLTEFKELLRKEEHLAKEVIKDHIIFGEKEKIINLFKK